MGKTLTAAALKSAILNANDHAFEVVHVPEWGVDVRIKALTGAERDRFEASLVSVKNGNQVSRNAKNWRARFLVLCIIDDDGNRVFSDDEAYELGKKNAAVIRRLHDVAARLSGITEEDAEELDEGFEPGQNGASTSA